MPGRALCLRCLRPAAVCYCTHLTPIRSATHVVFLQHPRESRVAIGTCRMAHLALPRSELHRGVRFATHPRVCALAADASGDVAVLYPGDDARVPEVFGVRPPRTLIVLDGTWHQVRTMWRENPALHRLPRIGVVRPSPGNYRIRREPAAHCLATVEAVVEALGRLEHDPGRFLPILRAFDAMVEHQLFYRRLRPNAPWRRTKRLRRPRVSAAREALRARHADLLVVYAEANAHPRRRGGAARDPRIASDAVAPELVHLVAERPATGERFEAIIAPRTALAPSTPHHLELSSTRLLAGEPLQAALARWQAFARSRDFVCAWGYYTSRLLECAGDPKRPILDLRDAVTRELNHRTSGIEQAATTFVDTFPSPWTEGRAGRRIAALATIVAHLSD